MNTVKQSVEERNMELMQTLDDAWNAQDVEIFRARHKPDVIVRWPGKTEPTVGIEDHTQESIEFWTTFPDQQLDNRPYKVFFASGDWTCSIARFRGTMKGPMKAADGTEMHWTLIRAALASVADTAIIPLQDVLGLGSEARMNLPGRQSGKTSVSKQKGTYLRRYVPVTR